MAKVTIEFLTLKALVSFFNTLPRQGYLIQTDLLTLTCSCNDTEIAKAVQQFDGSLIERVAPLVKLKK